MSKSGLAYQTHARGAVALTLLFIWMKTWQSAYCRALWAEVSGDEPWRPRLRPMLRTALRQAGLQPSGLFLLPLALLTALPFGPAYAFYQNLTVLDSGDDRTQRPLLDRALRLARLWQRQNFILIWTLSPYLMVAAAGLFLVVMPVARELSPDWTTAVIWIYAAVFVIALTLLSPFGLVVAFNIASAIVLAPVLLKSLLGVTTVYGDNPRAMFTSTFFAVVCGLTYLCLDPVIKAGYVLRCFYGESVNSGEDLRVELRRLIARAKQAAVVAALIVGLYGAGRAMAQESSPASGPEKNVPPAGMVSSQELDRAITRELSDRSYAWRMPREKPPAEKEGLIAAFLRGVAETVEHWYDTVRDFLRKLLEKFKIAPPPPGEHGPWLPELSGPLQLVLYGLLAVILSAAAVLLYRAWKRRGAGPATVTASPAPVTPDLNDEATTAEDLPEDSWRALAQQLLEQGELRLALRAAFLSSLAVLAGKRLISIARFKSNSDYRRELDRHAHSAPELITLFGESASLFESGWYGEHPVSILQARTLIEHQERMRTHGAQS
jgi:hypothetical protein